MKNLLSSTAALVMAVCLSSASFASDKMPTIIVNRSPKMGPDCG